jgi:hypothetical protein
MGHRFFGGTVPGVVATVTAKGSAQTIAAVRVLLHNGQEGDDLSA